MNLPKLSDFDLKGKNVIVRIDLDVPFKKTIDENNTEKFEVEDDSRINACLPTLKHILNQNPQLLVIVGHIGKIDDKYVSTLNLWHLFSNLLGEKVLFKENLNTNFEKNSDNSDPKEESRIILFENLRFFEGEEKNDENFVKLLIGNNINFYVNESFATSHRQHASIVGLPKLLPHAVGLRFAQEVENLEKVRNNPNHPTIAIVSGAKEDKLTYLQSFKQFADKILVGGALPKFLEDTTDEKLEIAHLTVEGKDITIKSIEKFVPIIESAKTIVVAGPLGVFEEIGHHLGTQRVLEAVAGNTDAFKVAGGGDTVNAINKFGLADKFSWVSVGGGAMLDFLGEGSLPGIKALLD